MLFVPILTDEKRAMFAPLLEAAREGSEAALLEAARLVEEPLRQKIRERIPNDLRRKFDSVDVMQMTYIDVLAAFQQFDGDTPDEFVYWLIEITMHNLDDLLRQRRRMKRSAKLERDIDLQTTQREVDAAAIARNRAESSSKEQDRRLRWLERAMRRLRLPERAMLRARFWGGLSYREMSNRFGRSPEALRKRCGRLIKKLRSSGPSNEVDPELR